MSNTIESPTQPPRPGSTLSRAVDRARASYASMSGDARKGIVSVGWTGMTQVGGLLIRVVSMVVLPRLLLPADYAIFSLAFAVMVTLDWFSDLGIEPAVMRNPGGLTPVFVSTAWWVGLGRAAVLMAITASLAYPLSVFYHEPQLLGLILSLSALPVVVALRSPGLPRLRRDLQYRSLFFMQMIGATSAMVATVSGAWLTQSAWAFIWGTLGGAAVMTFLSYCFAPQRPLFVFDIQAFHGVWNLSKQILFNTMAMAAWVNSDRLLGFKLISETQFGFYAVALNLSSTLDSLVSHAFDVHYSIMTRIEDLAERRAWHERMCRRLAYWGMPVMALAVVTTPVAIYLIFPAKWHGAAVPFALLNARLLPRLMSHCQYQYLVATARIRSATLGYVLAGAAQLTLLATLGQYFGAIGLACCLLATTSLQSGVMIALSRVEVDGRFKTLLITYAYTAASVVATILIYRP